MKGLFNLPSQSLKNQNKPAQKHQSIPKMNQRPQDTVSFGMAKLSTEGLQKLAKEAKVAPIVERFIEDLNILIQDKDHVNLMKTLGKLASEDEKVIENVVLHQDKEEFNRSFLHKMLHENLTEASSKFIDIVNSLKNERVKGQFHLLRNDDVWSHLHKAYYSNNTEMERKILDSVNSLEDEGVKGQFHLLRNNEGYSHFHEALSVNNTEIAKRIADDMLRIVPEEFAKIKFCELHNVEDKSFYTEIGKKVAGCGNLSTKETLDFLNNNRHLPLYQRFIEIVKENAL